MISQPVSMHTKDFLGTDRRREVKPESVLDLDRWDVFVQDANAFLHGFEMAYEIDEIALAFAGPFEVGNFIGRAMLEEDVVHFNAAIDTVITDPIHSAYEVRYDFLRIGDRPYRVECMALIAGVSPLHSPIMPALEEHGGPMPVHLSFKTPDEKAYRRACEDLRINGLARAQKCVSTYGEFSYFNTMALPLGGLYLKPRFNKRDGGV